MADSLDLDPSFPDFESSLKELETIVSRLEKPDVPLDDALKYFEEGVTLARLCQKALKQAEQQVQQCLEHITASES